MLTDSPLKIARPFLWLAAVAFSLGFLGYLFLSGGAQALGRQDSPAATAQAEPLAMARDLPKRV